MAAIAQKNKAPLKTSWLDKLKKKKNPPRKMNGWLLGETLGMGGYSKVKLGLNEKTGRKAALKIMFADENGQMSQSKIKQMKRELAVMEKVNHSNVIQLIEYDQNAEYPTGKGASTLPCILVVLEFAPGGELFDYLMFTGRFDEIATRTYFHQFIAGLEAIHEQGICHRDLKPENLLLDSQCNLKIADFGFATEFRNDQGAVKKMQTACGTKGYLAPELLKGKKYTHLCDIFAVGIIMFTTFAGFPPFQNAVETDWWWDKLSKGWKYLEQAKRLQVKKDISKHEHAGAAKKQLFWKAHERSVLFPGSFKYLIEYTLHPMPSCRYDINNIKQDAWYNGETYSQAELQAYLNQRVDTVKKERIDKIKKQVQESPEQVSFVKRPIAGGIPQGPVNPNVEFAMLGKQLDPDSDFEDNLESLDDESFVNTIYKYETVLQPTVIAARIDYVANDVYAEATVDPAKNLTIVRLSINFGNKGVNYGESVLFAVKQFVVSGKKDEEGKQVYEVCFKRLQGSHQAYKKAVEEFFLHKTILYSMI